MELRQLCSRIVAYEALPEEPYRWRECEECTRQAEFQVFEVALVLDEEQIYKLRLHSPWYWCGTCETGRH